MKYEWSFTTYGECDNISEIPEGAIVEFIEGEVCVGQCERCGDYLSESDSYISDEEGCLTCYDCMLELSMSKE